MKLKKLAALVCGMAVTCSSMVAFATVPSEKIGVGHVSPGMRVADLLASAGQPEAKIGDNWYYINYKVEVDKKDNPNIINEVSSRNPTLGSTGGVKIGQEAAVLNLAYGKADNVMKVGGIEEYDYFNPEYTRKMTFTVLNGVIVKIECELID